MTKLIDYARVSTKVQTTDRQEADLLAARVRRDDLYVDRGVSGARASRPEFDRALAALEAGQPRGKWETVTAEDGTPIAYVVASGDNLQWIATRFCLRPDWLADINSVRRDEARGLFAGDTLNLDAHTIFTVGDQNG